MRARKRKEPAGETDRKHLLEAYRLVVKSVREARSMQTLMEKERQMRRILHFMRMGAGAHP